MDNQYFHSIQENHNDSRLPMHNKIKIYFLVQLTYFVDSKCSTLKKRSYTLSGQNYTLLIMLRRKMCSVGASFLSKQKQRHSY